MECSDDLFKIDGQVEGITFKILHMLEEISGSSDLANVTKPGGTGCCLSEPQRPSPSPSPAGQFYVSADLFLFWNR